MFLNFTFITFVLFIKDFKMSSKNKKEIKNKVEEPASAYIRGKSSRSQSDTDYKNNQKTGINEKTFRKDEYITSEEFRCKGLETLERICKEHGLL